VSRRDRYGLALRSPASRSNRQLDTPTHVEPSPDRDTAPRPSTTTIHGVRPTEASYDLQPGKQPRIGRADALSGQLSGAFSCGCSGTRTRGRSRRAIPPLGPRPITTTWALRSRSRPTAAGARHGGRRLLLRHWPRLPLPHRRDRSGRRGTACGTAWRRRQRHLRGRDRGQSKTTFVGDFGVPIDNIENCPSLPSLSPPCRAEPDDHVVGTEGLDLADERVAMGAFARPDPTLSLTSSHGDDRATPLLPGMTRPPCGTECPGGHDSLTQLAFTTDFEC
jgi:hypothetical protein